MVKRMRLHPSGIARDGVIILQLLLPAIAMAQRPPDVSRAESVTVAVGTHYRAGAFHRWLFGGSYRDLWTMPIRAPVLDLRAFDGGLTPERESGGKQTKSLQFSSTNRGKFVFRSADKERVEVPTSVNDVGFIRHLARDQISNSHPAATLVVPPLLEAIGVRHDAPALVSMPDDAILGEYRATFAGRLGGIARTASSSDSVVVIDSDSLLQWINRDPAEQVNAPVYLAARLLDMLVNNWDRHPGQWKWARPAGDSTRRWEPISRDYDKAFISSSGLLPGFGRFFSANLMKFDSGYPSVRGLTWNSLGFDQRLLAGLARPVWDSVARATAERLTNETIVAAVEMMPAEYRATAPLLASRLRSRRDSLPAIAARFYDYLVSVVDIHGTDAADRATVMRVDDRYVNIRIDDSNGVPWFQRRFDAQETSAIRLYLHGGDDSAWVQGKVGRSISIRIIGGNGTNRLLDAAVVGGDRHSARLYDPGAVTDVRYGKDTLFDRRPLVWQAGGYVSGAKDYGKKMSPVLGLGLNHDVGIMPRIGLVWYRYGFRKQPYASRVALEGRHSFKQQGNAIALTTDHRSESSALHFVTLTQMSELELLNWHGLGNTSPQTPSLALGVTAPRDDFFSVQHRQWLFRPALALELSKTTGLTLGPLLKYSITDSTAARFISATLPYGAGRFGEVGMHLALYHDSRVPKRHARRGSVLDLDANYYPAIWDVEQAFGSLSAMAAGYVTLPVPLHPFVGLRVGGKKIFGDFPFHESAFIGGRNDVRTLDLQRYAGDASLYATAELRLPVARLTLLLPLNVGLLGTADVGRVYVKGDSPFGWHNAIGAGFWIGFHETTIDVRIMRANETGHAGVITLRLTPSGVLP